MSNYEDKPGSGTFWKFEPKNGKTAAAPGYKGALILPNGDVISVAIWVKETKDGKRFLSAAVDDRDGEYHAKRLGRRQMRMDDAARGNDPDAIGRAKHGDNAPGSRGSQRDLLDEDRPPRGRAEEREYQPRGRQETRPPLADDMDDEIPF